MSKDLDHTTSLAGASTSEDAVRGGLQLRPDGRPSDRPEAPLARPTKLRRWSVAELLAHAVPRPPASGVAH